MLEKETIAAIATPPGVGGLAVIRVSGSDAKHVATCVFKPINKQKNINKMPGYTAAFGHLCREEQVIDDGVALVFTAPHSYTGEDVVELSCHGGSALSRQVLQACIEAGARLAQPGEFTKRAFLNGKMALTQAESVLDLISAHSRQAAAAAHAAQRGNLAQKTQEIKENVVGALSHIAAWIDYPEEDVPPLNRAELTDTLSAALEAVDELIVGFEKGKLLKGGIRAAIVGSPNVGKSTLFNLLTRENSAIVTPVAGTTRDVLREEVLIEGIPLHLADTAGLHQTKDTIEREGIKRSNDEIEAADIVIAVLDSSQPLSADDKALFEKSTEKPTLWIFNKADLGDTHAEIDELMLKTKRYIHISALDQGSAQVFENAIIDLLHLKEIDPNAAMLHNQRQLAAAKEAQGALKEAIDALNNDVTYDAVQVCAEDAAEALARLTGENVSDAVIDQVFERFCVGK